MKTVMSVLDCEDTGGLGGRPVVGAHYQSPVSAFTTVGLIFSGVPFLLEHTKHIPGARSTFCGSLWVKTAQSYCEAGSGWVPFPDWLENILAWCRYT